jgi:hypothetical protein
MAFYARLYNWTQDASNNIGILASKQDGEWNNLVPAVNRCWDTQGTNSPQQSMNMANQKFINCGAGTNATDFAILSQIQGSSFTYAAATGTANAFVVALSPAPSSYTTGMVVRFTSNMNITGASTLNVNGLGAITITKETTLAMQTGDIITNQLCEVVYDGTNFQLLSNLNGLVLQNGAALYSADTGTTNAYAATLVPAISAYSTGLSLRLKVASSNTAAATVAVNGLAATAIRKDGTTVLEPYDIVSGQVITLIYDGTNFQLATPIFGSVGQNGQSIFNVTTGSANAYVLTLIPVAPAYSQGMVVRFISNFGNTGASTLNVNGLGAIAIKKFGSTALASGDIANNQAVEVMYDGTNFQLMVIPGTSGGSVTSITAGAGMGGGTITTSGTLTANYVQTQMTNLTTVPGGISCTAGAWSASGLSVTITPTSSSNKILILGTMCLNSGDAGTAIAYYRLKRGSTAICVSTVPQSNQLAGTGSTFVDSTFGITNQSCTFLDSPATTSATTYSFDVTTFSSDTLYVNRSGSDTNSTGYGRFASTIIAIEVAN